MLMNCGSLEISPNFTLFSLLCKRVTTTPRITERPSWDPSRRSSRPCHLSLDFPFSRQAIHPFHIFFPKRGIPLLSNSLGSHRGRVKVNPHPTGCNYWPPRWSLFGESSCRVGGFSLCEKRASLWLCERRASLASREAREQLIFYFPGFSLASRKARSGLFSLLALPRR